MDIVELTMQVYGLDKLDSVCPGGLQSAVRRAMSDVLDFAADCCQKEQEANKLFPDAARGARNCRVRILAAKT